MSNTAPQETARVHCRVSSPAKGAVPLGGPPVSGSAAAAELHGPLVGCCTLARSVSRADGERSGASSCRGVATYPAGSFQVPGSELRLPHYFASNLRGGSLCEEKVSM